METNNTTRKSDFEETANEWKTRDLRSRYEPTSFDGALRSAVRYTRKNNAPAYVYSGNSFMQRVFRVTSKESDARCPINNTGSFMYEVSGSTIVLHSLTR